ncbi:MAG TPA: hypothetical protein VK253_08270 [Candidatus Binatia bacterium]|nr:hypothetical protein [Candidatus Binatia bacterium]
MPKDYEVFKPSDENLAQLIVKILEERGYNAGYQLGYPHNKIFIKVDDKIEADRISGTIKKFLNKFNLTERGITTSKLNTLTNKLGSLIPESPNRNPEKPIENIEKKTENIDIDHSEKSEREVYDNVKLEELRGKIAEKLNQINTLIAENPNDRSNDKRRIERDTLVWVLQNML